MKKQSERPPIDDLFARKLGKMELTPGADAFERLQARMTKQTPKVKPVFWRYSTVQRYMAVAACLLLICLFGWQYQSTNTAKSTDQVVVNRKPLPSRTDAEKIAQQSKKSLQPVEETSAGANPQVVSPGSADRESIENRFADVQSVRSKVNHRPMAKAHIITQRSLAAIHKAAANDDEAMKDIIIAERKPGVILTSEEPAAHTKTPDLVAQKAVKPNLVSERVLTVTIAEPAALVAARVDAKASADSGTFLVGTQKEETKTPTKIINLWQQVKRVKSGETFASSTNNSDERGLLSRAYSELKQTLDKDKPQKQ